MGIDLKAPEAIRARTVELRGRIDDNSRRGSPPNIAEFWTAQTVPNTIFGFLESGQHKPAWLVRLLLIKAGDVETNPGPGGGTPGSHGLHPTRMQRIKFDKPPEKKPPNKIFRHKNRRTTNQEYNLNVLQWNCAGVRSKTAQLNKLLYDEKVSVAMIQESNLPDKVNWTVPKGYTCIRKERQTLRNDNVGKAGKNHGGVLMLFKQELKPNQVTTGIVDPADKLTEYVAADIWVNRKKLRFVNLYIPHISGGDKDKRVDNFTADALPNGVNTFIGGDVNGHAKSWDCKVDEDDRGKEIEEWAISNNFVVANTSEDGTPPPTRFNRGIGTESSPDVTLHHDSWVGKVDWRVLEDECSDHVPVVFSIKLSTGLTGKTLPRWSYKKANLSKFRDEIDTILEQSEKPDPDKPQSAHQMNKLLCDAILKSANRHIPKGNRANPKPWWNDEAQKLANERKQLRKEATQGEDQRKAFNAKSRESVKLTNELRRDAFQEYITTLDPKTEQSKVFGMMRSMEGKGKSHATGGEPMERKGKLLRTDAAKANGLVKEYAAVSDIQISKQDLKEKRPMLKEIKQECKCTEMTEREECAPFSRCELMEGIKKLKKGKKEGTDGVTNEMLKELGPFATEWLLTTLNLSWKHKQIPSEWRKSEIIPILKPGKDPKFPGSYRPISLTSCMCKLMEKLVQKRLLYWLEANEKLNQNQAGFRSLHSTEDQCLRVSQFVSDGFNNKPMKRTLMCLVDFQRAFDSVWKIGLYEKMSKMNIPNCYTQWCKAFLSDRNGRVKYGVATSGYKKFKEGLPQGSVLSPLLFLIFINDISDRMPEGVHISLFADDLAMWVQHAKLAEAEHLMGKALKLLERWSEKWKLKINTSKTVITSFTNWSKEAKWRPTELKLFGTELKFEETPVFLGITYDRTLSFAAQVNKIRQKMSSRMKVLGALRGKVWGRDKDDLRLVYLSYLRSAAEYCAPAWMPFLSDTQMEKLEKGQNQAARLITRCTSNTPTDSVLIEANLHPLKYRRQELAAVAYEKSKRLPNSNPRRGLSERNTHKRIKKNDWRTLAKDTIFNTDIASFPREPLCNRAAAPPWTAESKATFNGNLVEKIKRSECDEKKKKVAEETIVKQAGAALDIYTDGSAKGGTRKGGGGVLIIDNVNHTEYEITAAAGEVTCSFQAELIAIKAALQKIQVLQFIGEVPDAARINLYTDSKSAIECLASGRNQKSFVASKIWELLDSIAGEGNPEFNFQWIPSHCGVQGNERVDAIAKRASEMPQQEAQVDLNSAKATIRKELDKNWKRNAKVVVPGATAVRGEKEANLPQNVRTVLARFRTGGFTPELAWYRNFVTRKKPRPDSSICQRCQESDETVEHVMRDCPALSRLRLLHFGNQQPMSLLFEDPKTVAGFLRGAGVV